jgi:hypothetical protein
MRQELPRTGRIGRFARKLAEATDEKTARKIMRGFGEYPGLSNQEKSEWWKAMVERSKDIIGKDKTVEVLTSCGKMCCGITSRKRAKQAMAESGNLEELVSNLNRRRLGGGRFVLRDGHTIVGGYGKCYCGQVKHSKGPFEDLTYCHCSAGWYGQLFETALGRPVKVEVRKSIICGAEACEFEIHV